jgi:hypothetical protein
MAGLVSLPERNASAELSQAPSLALGSPLLIPEPIVTQKVRSDHVRWNMACYAASPLSLLLLSTHTRPPPPSHTHKMQVCAQGVQLSVLIEIANSLEEAGEDPATHELVTSTIMPQTSGTTCRWEIRLEVSPPSHNLHTHLS